MNTRILLTSVSIVSLALLITLGGCKKKAEPAEPTATPTAQEAVSAQTEQTICPVMGGEINKDLFTEYQGKKVYFCCPSCKTAFEKEPEKYLSKLPQYKE